jgi:hypothetical protein
MLICESIIWSDFYSNFLNTIFSFFLQIASLIYSLVDATYQIFMAIASARIFNNSVYTTLANKIYMLIGVVALFFIAYALLRAIADPDSAAKGDMAAGKIVPNIIKAIVLIAFVPFIFNLAYKLQDSMFSSGVLTKLILGGSETTASDATSIADMGKSMSNDIFITFFMPKSKADGDVCSNANFNRDDCLKTVSPDKVKGSVLFNTIRNGIRYGIEFANGTIYLDLMFNFFDKDDAPAPTLYDSYQLAQETGNYSIYEVYSPNAANGDIDFQWILQGLVGCFLVYVFLSFCIDMGLRAIKLCYYQIIAPIPILSIIIPGKHDIFNKWVKSVASTFFEVVVRVGAVLFGVLMINKILNTGIIWGDSYLLGDPSGWVKFFAKIFIIVGILLFIKQVPQLISDMFGIKSGSFKLGIGDKLRDAGAFGVAGAIGGAGLAIGNKYGTAWAATAGQKNRLGKTLLKGTGSALNPANFIRYGAAGVNAYKSTKDAKGISEFGSGMNKGVAEALSAPTMAERIKGNASDFGESLNQAVTTNYSPYNSKRQLAIAAKYDEFNKHKSNVNDILTSDPRYKQITSYYDEQIANANKAGDFETAMDLTTKKTTATIKAKNAIATEKLTGHVAHFARNNVGDLFANNINDPTTNKAIDIKLQGELDKFSANLRENSALVQSSLADTHTVLKDSNGSVIDPNNINDIIKSVKNGSVGIVNNIGTSSDKSASAIRSKAMEEEAKKDTKK